MQSISVIGNNNIVIQNSSNVVIWCEKHKLRIEKASERYEQNPKSILEFLNVYKCPLKLIGRDNEFNDFVNWLDGDQRISIRLITGSAGTGKTKFASELLRLYETQSDWICGFVPDNELKTFLKLSNPSSWNWDKSIFLVFDYASAHWEDLRIFFRILAGKNKYEFKNRIRILLLERHGNLESGWLYNIFDRSQSGEVVEKLFEPNYICRFSIISIENQEKIIRSTISKYFELFVAGESKPFLNTLEQVIEGITSHYKFNTPLDVIMATIVNIEDGTVNNSRITKNELALKVAQYEIARIEKMTSYDFDNTIIMLHLASFITICQGIKYGDLEGIIEIELKSLKLSSNLSINRLKIDFIKIYTQENIDIYSNNSLLKPISPDIIGEAFIKIVFKKLWENEKGKIKNIFNRAHQIPDAKPFICLTHLIQDFCTEDWLTKEPDSWDNSPIIWLNEMIASNDVDFVLLISIHEAVSDDHLVLSQISLEVAVATLNVLIKLLKSKTITDEQLKNSIIFYTDSIIRTISDSGENNIAIQALEYISRLKLFNRMHNGFYKFNHFLVEATIYHDQGDFEKAIKKLNFTLNEIENLNDAAYLLDIKSSLYTLKSEILRDSRKNLEDAKECSKTAIDVFEKIEHDNETVYLENRAALLTNYSNILADTRHFQESLDAIEEVVLIYRKLSRLDDVNRYKYLFDLAKNMHNASNRYSDLGINDKACKFSEEAVSILTPFYKKSPRIYREYLAGALYGLGLHYSNLNKYEDAITALNRALGLYIEAVKLYPKKFVINVVWAINQLGTIYFQEKDFEKSIEHFKMSLSLIDQKKLYLPVHEKEYADVLNKIAECYINKKNYVQAIKYAKKACKQGATLIRKDIYFPLVYAEAIDTLAHAYYGNGEMNRAENSFIKAINLLTKIDEKNIFSSEIENIKAHLNDCKKMKLVLGT